MSTLVTGGEGFIGGHVVERLRESRERVVSYDRGPAATAVAATIAEHDVRGIVHAAGMADPLLSIGMPAASLLEAARLAGFGGRIVLLSASDDDDRRGEVDGCRYGLDVVSLRVSEAYGPGRVLRGALQDMLDAALEHRALRLSAGADHPIQPIHVEDVARAVLAALAAPDPTGRIYDITGGEQVTLGHVAALVRDRVPGAEIEFGPGALSGPDRQGPVAITAADHELGYRPRWGLARGIDDYCTWREASDVAEGVA